MNKSLLFLGGAGATGAAATGLALNKDKIFGSQKTYSISSLLNKEHKILISADESSHWDSKWKEYLASGVNEWNIPEWKGKTDPASIPQSFKDKCSNISNKEVVGVKDPIYEEVVKYCSRGKVMTDRFKEDGVELMSKDGKDNEWNDRFDKYKVLADNLKIKGIDIKSTDDKGTSSNLDKIKNGCHDVSSKPVNDSDYSYESIKEWCTIAKASN
ncbi:hypothetical protein HF1_02700 [Mycoplasma haemofelis str. Langford 1]|uniref:Uncharacterized protein n=1 Tax=Mycoplasma haemofelis (strain Langford 1) TaxID=941640 RepID=E8ZKW2_MYCHL|nr:hypothetical protein [Mycoplasma haemofelis]CBY92278.1 hypothetical protein HF1_02700 [Mycoplasma haemofelis str. Langford 1]